MARNIEFKARASDFEAQARVAASLSDKPPMLIQQEDTFFHVTHGRLKLREPGDGNGELIWYNRVNVAGPKQSTYVRSHTSDPCSLKESLTNALGIGVVVKKTRRVFLAGQARIHLDEVTGLGKFIEVEVVLRPGQSESEGITIAEELMQKLGIEQNNLLSCAYADLLSEGKPNSSHRVCERGLENL